MRLQRILLTSAIWLSAGTVCAERPQAVVLEFCLVEKRAEQVEHLVTNRLEKRLLALPGVSSLDSTSRDDSAQFEIHFTHGATRNDLRTVDTLADAFDAGHEVMILSRTTRLAQPRPDGLPIRSQDCARPRR